MSTTVRYQQLKLDIVARISQGELRPGDRVPSENELVHAAGVSRMTANRALRELTDEGYVERVPGVGTFVADQRAASHVLEVRNIADEIARRGRRHRAQVLKQLACSAAAGVASQLHLGTRGSVFRVVVVHFEDDRPIQLEDRYVEPQFGRGFLEQDFSVLTPSAWLNALAPLQAAEHTVRAAMPNAFVRRHLHLGAGEPCLVVIRRTWANSRPVTFAKLHHPGSRFELTGHYNPPGLPPVQAEP